VAGGVEMIAELKVIPVGKGESLSLFVAECVKIVRDSGVRYEVTAMGTLLEGDYDRVMAVIEKCHHKLMTMTNRVMITIDIDDRVGAFDEINTKVEHVEHLIK
jgi:uncharacterized protein (TIGR00106 family)